ncbi:MAG: M48 family metallopeptidase [Euryarchaeota archaeon]|nr:M48 family metallopeptidase [Euryarchaeota archaeon]
MTDDPGPGYKVRESLRARRPSLRVSFRGELEVVVPRRYDRRRIPALLAQKRDWIERTVRRIRDQRGLLGDHVPDVLPALLDLPAIGERWAVDYESGPRRGLRLVERPPEHGGETGHVVLRGNTGDGELCRRALRRWVMLRARERLVPWLQEVSEEAGLPFASVAVRGPSTRWASCSFRKGISLSCKLTFLPHDLVRYVFLHELVHTVHPDHSRRFWAALALLDPDCRLRDRKVRRAWSAVPLWMDG